MNLLAIFVIHIDNEYNVTEEMASLVSLKDITTSPHLYETVKNTFKQFSLTFVNIFGEATDGTLMMAGKKKGLTKLRENNAAATRKSHLMKYCCIKHQ